MHTSLEVLHIVFKFLVPGHKTAEIVDLLDVSGRLGIPHLPNRAARALQNLFKPFPRAWKFAVVIPRGGVELIQKSRSDLIDFQPKWQETTTADLPCASEA